MAVTSERTAAVPGDRPALLVNPANTDLGVLKKAETRWRMLASGETLYVLDAAKNLPFHPDTVKTSVNWLAFVAPAGVVTTLSQCKSLPAAMDAAAVFGLGLSLTGVMTDFIKNYCGRFRPNYFHACGWNGTCLLYTSPSPRD